MISTSPHCGQPVPCLSLTPSSQKAGHSPCLLDVGLSPKRIRPSAKVRRPAAGVNVYLDSIRPDVQAPLLSRQGTICSVLPPLSCRLAVDDVYVCTSLLTCRLVTMFHVLVLGDVPDVPANVSCHTRLKPE